MPPDDRPVALRVQGVSRSYGRVRALDDVSLELRRGEFVTLLGPSGSGKTTLLKAVAGFEDLDAGRLQLNGRDLLGLPPAKRDIGMVFQSYALFPHMDVARNVGFPLAMRHVPKPEIERRVRAALELVELDAMAGRLPSQLSGGQQQRVALARAIVFDPPLLLLDEPFSALDRKLRESMQLELRRLQRRLGLTTLFVTHDQEEAMLLSDRVAVMNGGRIEQIGTPHEVYERPATPFVAGFIGASNLLVARPEGRDGDYHALRLPEGGRILAQLSAEPVDGSEQRVMLRPERIRVLRDRSQAETAFAATVLERVYLGHDTRYRVRLEGGSELMLRVPAGEPLPALEEGAGLLVGWSIADLRVL